MSRSENAGSIVFIRESYGSPRLSRERYEVFDYRVVQPASRRAGPSARKARRQKARGQERAACPAQRTRKQGRRRALRGDHRAGRARAGGEGGGAAAGEDAARVE